MQDELNSLAVRFKDATRRKRELEAQAKAAASEAHKLGIELVALGERMELRSIPMTDGTTIMFLSKVSAKQEDKAASVAWFKNNGYENMLSVHYRTLESLCKERAEAGLPPPDGVTVTFFTTASLRDGGRDVE